MKNLKEIYIENNVKLVFLVGDNFDNISENKDYIHKYEEEAVKENNSIYNKAIGIQLYQYNNLISSCLIRVRDDFWGIEDNSFVIKNSTLFLCCPDSIISLSLPTLELKWRKKCDWATNFSVYEIKEDLVIYGEITISRMNALGTIKWQVSGKDIWVSPTGEDTFSIFKDSILCEDWDGNKYRIDFDGNIHLLG